MQRHFAAIFHAPSPFSDAVRRTRQRTLLKYRLRYRISGSARGKILSARGRRDRATRGRSRLRAAYNVSPSILRRAES